MLPHSSVDSAEYVKFTAFVELVNKILSLENDKDWIKWTASQLHQGWPGNCGYNSLYTDLYLDKFGKWPLFKYGNNDDYTGPDCAHLKLADNLMALHAMTTYTFIICWTRWQNSSSGYIYRQISVCSIRQCACLPPVNARSLPETYGNKWFIGVIIRQMYQDQYGSFCRKSAVTS